MNDSQCTASTAVVRPRCHQPPYSASVSACRLDNEGDLFPAPAVLLQGRDQVRDQLWHGQVRAPGSRDIV